MKEEVTKHIPVLQDEVIMGLSLAPGKIVVDATLGGGGHAKALLQEVLPGGAVIAIDTDKLAIERFMKRSAGDEVLKKAIKDGSLKVVQSNYSEVRAVVKQAGRETVDAILADLGFSSDQIESGERGFSFQEDGPLDMRLDQSKGVTAGIILNTYDEAEIEKILRDYGDEVEARRIAKAIVIERSKKLLETTRELRELIEAVYPKKRRYAQKIHPATKTFQALRIVVNQELDHLAKFLEEAVAVLRPGGRLAIITFHSGEDRIVKQFFKAQAEGCICPPNFPICQCGRNPRIKILTKKPITATSEEETKNPRARSAKLRIIEKV